MQDPTQNKSDRDTHAQKQRIQYGLSIADADSRKKDREKEAELLELKRLEKQLVMLQINISDRKQRIKKIEDEKMMIDNEIKTLKKKLNEII
jgi:hypothetical protein